MSGSHEGQAIAGPSLNSDMRPPPLQRGRMGSLWAPVCERERFWCDFRGPVADARCRENQHDQLQNAETLTILVCTVQRGVYQLLVRLE